MKGWSRYIAIALGLAIFMVIAYYFANIVTFILIAWVLSLIGQPLMDFFQNKVRVKKFQLGRALSAVLTIIIFILGFALLIGTFIPLLVEQARNLSEVEYQSIASALEEPLNSINAWLYKMGLASESNSADQQLLEGLKNWFNPSAVGTIFSSILGLAGNLLFAIFSIIFITFFFLKEENIMERILTAITPSGTEKQVSNALDSISKLLTRYFGGILFQVIIITLFVSVALGLLGIQNALLIGFFAALVNVIPYLGPIIGATFGLFITISSNLDLDFYTQMSPMLLKVLAVFAGMQLLDNFILQPFIFSNSVKAHPLEIFIVILMGAQINGITGMILAIPVYTVLRVIAKEFLSEFKFVQKLTDGME